MDKQTELVTFQQRTQAMANGCIEWTGNLNEDGYGRFTFKRKNTLAHRAAYRLLKGTDPGDFCVLHRCDNPRCVNPDHLFLGDRGDNARDMSSKGRQWLQRNPDAVKNLTCPAEKKARGSAHGMSKLTEATVSDIRNRAAAGQTGKAIAAEFGISRSLASQIIRGEIWKHAPGPTRSQS